MRLEFSSARYPLVGIMESETVESALKALGEIIKASKYPISEIRVNLQ